MTVRELITALERLPDDSQVKVRWLSTRDLLGSAESVLRLEEVADYSSSTEVAILISHRHLSR